MVFTVYTYLHYDAWCAAQINKVKLYQSAKSTENKMLTIWQPRTRTYRTFLLYVVLIFRSVLAPTILLFFMWYSFGTVSGSALLLFIFLLPYLSTYVQSHGKGTTLCTHTHTRKIKHQFSVRYSVEIFCRYVALYTTRWLFRFWCSIYWKKIVLSLLSCVWH